jgi:hypothetical protein
MGTEPTDRFLEIYLADRRLYLEMSRDAMKSFDTNIVAIAAGGLTLSITFLHEIAPQPRFSGILVCAWVAWVSCLVVILLSYLNHEASLAHQIKVLDDYERMHSGEAPRLTEEARRTNKPQERERRLNMASLALLVVGIVFFAIFSVMNLPLSKEADVNKLSGAKTGTPNESSDVREVQKSATTPPISPALMRTPQPASTPAQEPAPAGGAAPSSGSEGSGGSSK